MIGLFKSQMENQVSNVAVFLLVCLVFAMSSAFPIMSWMNRLGGADPCNLPASLLSRPQFKAGAVGVYLLQRPYPPDGTLTDPFLILSNPSANITAGTRDYTITYIVKSQFVPPSTCSLSLFQCGKSGLTHLNSCIAFLLLSVKYRIMCLS